MGTWAVWTRKGSALGGSDGREAGWSRGGAVASRKGKVRAPAGHCARRAASGRRGTAVVVGLAPSSYSRQIMTVMKIANTQITRSSLL